MKSNLKAKPTRFSNWGDHVLYPLASFLLPLILKISFLTPNVLTILSFAIYCFGAISLFLSYPNHLLLAAFCLVFGYLLDIFDGDVARARNMQSELGNYLDKVLDMIKIFVVMTSLSFAVYQETGRILYIYLGFVSAAFFYLRYYVKLETVLRQASLDTNYLDKSSEKMKELVAVSYKKHDILRKSISGRLQVFWETNRLIFFIDEAEVAILTGFFALISQLHIALWIFGVGNVLLFIWRFFERGYQNTHKTDRVYFFMRK